MFIEAIHIDTREQCYVNTEFIVDIFKGTNTQYIAYTFDEADDIIRKRSRRGDKK